MRVAAVGLVVLASWAAAAVPVLAVIRPELALYAAGYSALLGFLGVALAVASKARP